ncbi:MAG TPA: hypothetical protein VFU93_12385 [Acidimicrobiales bacterium]|nr:hypothetical protein [Acidimicrobiales bacterium]
MRRLGVLVGIVLAGGLLAANATAAPTAEQVHLRPASTTIDSTVRCDVPEVPPSSGGPGAVVVTFTVLPAGC